MSDSGSRVNRYLVDQEKIHGAFTDLGSQVQPTERLQEVNILAKKLEMKLAAARLAQAEYCFEALSARRDYLEARCAQGRASGGERDALDWVSQALPVNESSVAEFAAELDMHKRELDSLIEIASPGMRR